MGEKGFYMSKSSAEHGVTFGCCLAMVLSYAVNKSILWAIVHGVCSWFYVIYFAVTN